MDYIIDRDIPEYIKETMDAMHSVLSDKENRMLHKLIKINKGEHCILKKLYFNVEPMRPSELASEMGMTKGRISTILNSLEKNEQVFRDIDKNNRRNVIVKITEKGKTRIIEEMKELQEKAINAFEKLGEKDSREFARLVIKLFQLLNE